MTSRSAKSARIWGAAAFYFAVAAGDCGGKGLAAEVVISEFMAKNHRTLVDEDGDSSDWIELHNPGAETLSLEGWFLTDDADRPDRWRFPAVELGPGEFLIVFASGKDRAESGSELHTSFRLDSDGEYLAVVAPDARTVRHAYAPKYPEQVGDTSYGLLLVREVAPLVDVGASARVHVPAGPELARSWTSGDEPFPDGGWLEAATGIGFDLSSGDEQRFVKVEDFEGLEVGEPGPESGWTTSPGDVRVVPDPSDPAGNVLSLRGERAQAYTALVVPTGTTSTVFFRMRSRGSAASSLGLSRVARPFLPQHLDSELAIDSGGSHASERRLLVRDRADLDAGGLAAEDIWYSVWMVIDNSAPSYRVYVEGGGLAVPTLLEGERDGQTDFELRAGAAATRLESFFVRTGRGQGGTILVDDIYLAPGPDLTNPASRYERLLGDAGDVRQQMHDRGTSIYVRIPFQLAAAPAFDSMSLEMRYDDGFVAFLNGTEVARRNAPDIPAWNSAATAERSRSSAVVFERIDITPYAQLLDHERTNVLAVHGLNAGRQDPRYLLLPRMEARTDAQMMEGYAPEPSPGAPNLEVLRGRAAAPEFSTGRGLCESPLELEITTATPGATIHYTTDSTTPSETLGAVYSGAIPIGSTTVVRALAWKPGSLSSDVVTHTYIFVDDVVRQGEAPSGYPEEWKNGSGTLPADYGMDPEITGHPAYAEVIHAALRAIPTISIVTDARHLFDPAAGIYQNPQESSVAWERPASVELIYPDGRRGFQEDAGLRIQGGASRDPAQSPKHSLRLLFKAVYGAKKLKFPLFGGEGAVDSFDTIVLRAGFNHTWVHHNGFLGGDRARAQYVRDPWAKDTQRAMGHAAPHNIYAHLYLNGMYWGLYNPTERPSAPFGAAYFGGRKSEYDALNAGQVVDGDRTAWEALFEAATGLAEDSRYAALEERLDIDAFIDYMILHQYGGNLDWDSHNWYALRHRTPGGRFHFVSWDSERLFVSLSDDRLGLDERRGPSGLFQRLIANAEFRLRFADHAQRHLFSGGLLTPTEVVARWEERSQDIVDAVVAESARWGDYRRDVHQRKGPFELLERDAHWMEERVRLLREYFPRRTDVVIGQYMARGLYPNIRAPRFSQLGGTIPAGFRLGIAVAEGTLYYTLDGADPRLEGGAASPAAISRDAPTSSEIVPVGAPARALVPEDGHLGLEWTAIDFDDASWTLGTTGVGFSRRAALEDLIGLDAGGGMAGRNASVYIRIPFELNEPRDLSLLGLRMQYDDGFVAYLNGEEVARRGAPEDLAWNAAATSARAHDAVTAFEAIDLTSHSGLLRVGRNVLAIQGLNESLESDDLLILPVLAASVGVAESIALERTTRVKARALHEGEWSALSEALFVVDAGLRIAEIMYHPQAPGPGEPYSEKDFEFVEIENTGRRPIRLAGVRLAGGIEFEFTDDQTLAPGGVTLVVRNIEAFAARYGLDGAVVAGEFRGSLSNQSERLTLVGREGEVLFDCTYDDDWYPETDGGGTSLVLGDPGAQARSWELAESWRPSDFPLGSPGASETPPEAPPLGAQLPGDMSRDGRVNLLDVMALMEALFTGRGELPCDGTDLQSGGNLRLLDVSGDARVNLADCARLLSYLFERGPEPVLGVDCVPIAGCPDVCAP